jgi:hypothetical protein
MPGPLTAVTFPTPADLLATGWSTWWRTHKLPPSPDQLLTHAAGAFWEWRAEIMLRHSAYLADRLGDRLLPLYDLVIDLVLEHVNCRGWEFPDPEAEQDDVISSWIAWALTCLRWTLVYEACDPPEVTYAEASAFLLEAKRQPPARPPIIPSALRHTAPRSSQTVVWPQPALF